MEGFLHYQFGGLIFGGASTWRGFFSEFYGMLHPLSWLSCRGMSKVARPFPFIVLLIHCFYQSTCSLHFS